ncbi:MAG TPA: MFS transporter [Syntrophorhabdus sp.]|nr:MFS transporter [Syntrophorhabdus sp.]
MRQEAVMMRWVILAQLCLCMLSYALIFQSIPPIMSLVISQFKLSHYQAGLLMSLFALPGILVSLPAGMVADRYGVKPVGIFSFLLALLGSFLVANGPSFEMLLVGRILAGIGASSLVITIPQAIAQWFSDRHMGIAMGIYNTAMPIGTIISLNGLSHMAGVWGWRVAVWATVFFTAIIFVIFAVFYRQPDHKDRLENQGKKDQNREGIGTSIFFVGFSWALFNASIISLFTFAPDFLVSRGMTLDHAGFSTSLVMIASMCLSPIVGLIIDKIGQKELFIAAGGLGMAVFIALIPGIGGAFSLFLLCVGVASALIPVSVFSLAADVVSFQRLGLGYGILSMLNNVGMFVGPQAAGLGRDLTGSYQISFLVMAFFAFFCTITILSLWLKRRGASSGNR